jgi:hypothetical protein
VMQHRCIDGPFHRAASNNCKIFAALWKAGGIIHVKPRSKER